MATIRVAHTDELPPGKGKVLEVGERQLVVYNAGGRFFATATRRVRSRNPIAEPGCAPHGQLFDVYAEDSPARVRAEVEVCLVRVKSGAVWIELPDE